MANALCILALATGLGVVLQWGFRALPRERWQILAAVPSRKRRPGEWSGVNLTTYGVLTATVLAVAVFLVLMASVDVRPATALPVVVALLGAGVPAAKTLARVLEGTLHGHSIAAAALVAVAVAPLAAWLAGTPPAATLGAAAVAYVLGESFGRLASISFGCCYGRPVAELGASGRRLFDRFHVAFQGATKKIAYVAGFEGVRVVPVQAVTAVVLASLATIGSALFVAGWPRLAFVVSLVGSQAWRCWAELWRADHSSAGMSQYRRVAVAVAALALLMAALLPPSRTPAPDMLAGFAVLWDPALLLALQLLWLIMFRLTGLSMVTESIVSFRVRQDRI